MKLSFLSGELGIRTPGPVTVNSFQDCRNRPLCQLSAAKVVFICTTKKVFWNKLNLRYNFIIISTLSLNYFLYLLSNVAKFTTNEQNQAIWQLNFQLRNNSIHSIIIIPKFDLPNLKQILFLYVKYNKSLIPFIFVLAFN